MGADLTRNTLTLRAHQDRINMAGRGKWKPLSLDEAAAIHPREEVARWFGIAPEDVPDVTLDELLAPHHQSILRARGRSLPEDDTVWPSDGLRAAWATAERNKAAQQQENPAGGEAPHA